MPEDTTAGLRHVQSQLINAAATDREKLEAVHGRVWDTNELTKEFEVKGFMAPYVIVRRREDGKMGTLEFQHHPRYYYDFQPHE